MRRKIAPSVTSTRVSTYSLYKSGSLNTLKIIEPEVTLRVTSLLIYVSFQVISYMVFSIIAATLGAVAMAVATLGIVFAKLELVSFDPCHFTLIMHCYVVTVY